MKRTFTLKSEYDSLPLSVMTVCPDAGQPKAIVQFAHGMKGIKERFVPFFDYLASHGFICVANDHRGHGGSVLASEDLGYMYSGGWKALVSDMKTVSDWAVRTYPDLPLFLIGHSMGSLAARIYAYEYGYMLSGLFICGNPGQKRFSFAARLFLSLVCRLGFGRSRLRRMQQMVSDNYNRRFKEEGREAWTCSVASLRKEFAENPLCNYYFTANASYNLLCMMRETYAKRMVSDGNVSFPVFFLSGEDDPCMISKEDLLRSAECMRKSGYESVECRIYHGMRHEILNEKDRLIVWNDIVNYIRFFLPDQGREK